MQVEELRLTQAQSAAAEAPQTASGNKKGKAKKTIAAALPTQNGQADSLSINSSILQVMSITLCFIGVCAMLLLQSSSILSWLGVAEYGRPSLTWICSIIKLPDAIPAPWRMPSGRGSRLARAGKECMRAFQRRTTGQLCWSWPRMHRGQRSLAAGTRATPRTPPSGGMRSL